MGQPIGTSLGSPRHAWFRGIPVYHVYLTTVQASSGDSRRKVGAGVMNCLQPGRKSCWNTCFLFFLVILREGNARIGKIFSFSVL